MVDKKGLDKFCEYSLNISKNKISEKVLSRILNIAPMYNNNTEDKSSINGLNMLVIQSFLNSYNVSNKHFDSFFFK
jgi:hypothetical protein